MILFERHHRDVEVLVEEITFSLINVDLRFEFQTYDSGDIMLYGALQGRVG